VQKSAIDKAIAEAEKFLERARGIEWYPPEGEYEYMTIKSGPKDTGALRRQSLELTRALAEMRRP